MRKRTDWKSNNEDNKTKLCSVNRANTKQDNSNNCEKSSLQRNNKIMRGEIMKLNSNFSSFNNLIGQKLNVRQTSDVISLLPGFIDFHQQRQCNTAFRFFELIRRLIRPNP